MRTSFTKIVLLLLMVIVLPIAVLMVFEVRTLNESERVMQTVYSKQLETLLFSINQYSDDVVNSIANRIDEAWKSGQAGSGTREWMGGWQGVAAVFFYPLGREQQVVSVAVEPVAEMEISGVLQQSLASDSALVKKLRQYRESGFRKLAPYREVESGGETYNTLLFVLGEGAGSYTACIVLLHPIDFIEELLGPKMEQVAGEEFVLSASRRGSQLVYTTDSLMENKAQSSPMWLLPAYDLELYVPGNSIQMMVRERTNSNIMMISVVALVLLLGFVLVFRGIRKEVQLAQTKSDFVSNVSHEIRTPLALISMFAETLLMGRVKSEEKKAEYYEIIAKETSRLTNIVNKILNFSQIEANKKSYHFEQTDLNKTVQEVLHTYSFHLQNKGFEHKLNLSAAIPMVKADKEAVMEAVINLLDNAIKYSRNEKEIGLSTGVAGNYATIAVTDKGVGIESKKVRQIFDKFYRITQGDIYQVQGAGLGLSIVKHIMDAHHGKVEVHSEPGKGSTFILLFPIFEEKKL